MTHKGSAGYRGPSFDDPKLSFLSHALELTHLVFDLLSWSSSSLICLLDLSRVLAHAQFAAICARVLRLLDLPHFLLLGSGQEVAACLVECGDAPVHCHIRFTEAASKLQFLASLWTRIASS